MMFKLSPMAKYNIVFWSITIPITPLVLFLATVALLNPFKRIEFMNTVEIIVMRICNWRNNLSIVKYHYEKSHLFEMLSKSSG